MKRFIALFFTLFLLGCAGGGTPVNDFTNRATVYAWIDVSDISGNHLFNAQLRQYQPRTDSPFYGAGIEKFEGGYLIYQHAVRPGTRVEFSSLALQSCAVIICGNTINEYNFGPFGSAPGQVSVPRPGVYFMGKYELIKTKSSFFGPGEFDTRRTNKGPSQQAMLAALLKDAPPDHPIVEQRIRARMAGQ